MGDVQKKINDQDASRDMILDLEGGVNVGLKYSPETIQSVIAKLENKNAFSEKGLRSAYVNQINSMYGALSKEKISLDESGGFAQTSESFWDFDPVLKAMYSDYKHDKENQGRLGQAYLVAVNAPKAIIP